MLCVLSSLLLLNVGCDVLAADSDRQAPPTKEAAEEPPWAHAPTAADILKRVEDLTAMKRYVLAESMGELTVSCPYTRASLQLPATMALVFAKVDAEQIDPDGRERWERMVERVDAQVAVLDMLALDIRMPVEGDGLYGAAAFLVDRAALEMSPDPVGDARRLVEQNDAIVQEMSRRQQDHIREHSDIAYELLGEVTMKLQTAPSHADLKALLPHVRGEEARAQLAALLALMELHQQHGC